MKCRGCGEDTQDVKVEGLGWMHYKCELKRLEELLFETMRRVDNLEDGIAELEERR